MGNVLFQLLLCYLRHLKQLIDMLIRCQFLDGVVTRNIHCQKFASLWIGETHSLHIFKIYNFFKKIQLIGFLMYMV